MSSTNISNLSSQHSPDFVSKRQYNVAMMALEQVEGELETLREEKRHRRAEIQALIEERRNQMLRDLGEITILPRNVAPSLKGRQRVVRIPRCRDCHRAEATTNGGRCQSCLARAICRRLGLRR